MRKDDETDTVTSITDSSNAQDSPVFTSKPESDVHFKENTAIVIQSQSELRNIDLKPSTFTCNDAEEDDDCIVVWKLYGEN